MELTADVPVMSNRTTDFCLAEANYNTSEWNCVERRILNDVNDGSNNFAFNVKKDGTYAVVFNPSPLKAVVVEEDCNWVC